MPRLDPVCSVEEAFAASVKVLWPSDTPRRAVAAVSGGADSTALLALCAKSGLFEKVVCAHFNHALRGGESDDDERFVRKLCDSYDLVFRSERWRRSPPEDLPRPDRNRQAAARKGRYQFLAQVAAEEGCDTILTAHHARDQVETILLNLARGGGSGAWEGIRTAFEMNGVRIARPLLALSPDRIRTYLESHGGASREDSSNRDRKYKRNWMRLELLPKVSGAWPTFEEELVARWSAYQREVEVWKTQVAEMRKHGLDRGKELLIRREDLARLPPEGRFVCLQELLRGMSSDALSSGWAPTRRRPLEALFALLDEGREGEVELPGRILAKARGLTISFFGGRNSTRNTQKVHRRP